MMSCFECGISACKCYVTGSWQDIFYTPIALAHTLPHPHTYSRICMDHYWAYVIVLNISSGKYFLNKSPQKTWGKFS